MEACHSTSCDNISCRSALPCRASGKDFSEYEAGDFQSDQKLYNPYWGLYLCGTADGEANLTTEFDA